MIKLFKDNAYLICLILIFMIFLSTRLYQISSVPASVYWDEASIGYNAYSIATTGKDEWGKRFPIHFRAFGEFKLPVYIYAVAVAEKVIGFNTLAVRLPAVLFSLGSLGLLYLLILKIADQRVALISTFLLSISSWFFIFSRAGYEVSAGLMFYLFGIYLTLQSRKLSLFLVMGTVSFILSMYSYNSFRILTPLTILVLLVFSIRQGDFRRIIAPVLLSTMIFLVSLIPIIRLLVFDAGFARASTLALLPAFEQVYDLQGRPHFQLIYDRDKSNFSQNLLTLGKNYLTHFSPDFLFIHGDSNSRNHLSGFGQLYFIDIPFLILGLIYLLKSKNKYTLPLLALLFLSPLPASLYKESPHALRSLPLVVFLSVISAYGIIWTVKMWGKKLVLVCVTLYIISFVYFFFNFIHSYNLKSSLDWQFPYSQVFAKYSNQFSNFDKIVISDHYGQPYIFALYYLKYPSMRFIQDRKLDSVNNWGFSTVSSFDKFIFGVGSIPKGHLLVFTSPEEKLANYSLVDTIYNLDKSVGLYVYDVKN